MALMPLPGLPQQAAPLVLGVAGASGLAGWRPHWQAGRGTGWAPLLLVAALALAGLPQRVTPLQLVAGLVGQLALLQAPQPERGSFRLPATQQRMLRMCQLQPAPAAAGPEAGPTPHAPRCRCQAGQTTQGLHCLQTPRLQV